MKKKLLVLSMLAAFGLPAAAWATATGGTGPGTGNVTQQDNTGDLASGANSTASIGSSTATGINSTAVGNGSTAVGIGSKVSGNQSTAVGDQSNGSGAGSAAIGYGSTASGGLSTAGHLKLPDF
jgi:hypothetical protein